MVIVLVWRKGGMNVWVNFVEDLRGALKTRFFFSRSGKLSDDKLREIEGGFNGRKRIVLIINL
jgi:hypothetical protein